MLRRICVFLIAALPSIADSLPDGAPKPPTPREVAWRILSGVHLAAAKAQAAVQPYVMLHLAENTVEFNRKLALLEFRDAFADTRILESTYRIPLEAQIVKSVAPIDIPTAIDLVRTIRPNPAQRLSRDSWDRSVQSINAQLLIRNRASEAIDLVKLVSLPGVFPNHAASFLISTLPLGDDRRLGLFGYAATCYRQLPFPGFTTLIEDHWRTMPRTLVVLAADAVADDGSHASNAERAQVLPILREVDAPRALRLLDEHPEIEDDEAAARADRRLNFDDLSLVQRVALLAQRNPTSALASANSIHDPDLREQAILQVMTQAFSSGAGRDVTNQALQMLQPAPALDKPVQIAEQQMNASFEAAARLLAIDLDSKSECGVNPAPRDWWPSTAAYRTAIHESVALFQTGAERFLPRFQHDADLYLVMSIEFARALMGEGNTATPQMTCPDAVNIIKEGAQS